MKCSTQNIEDINSLLKQNRAHANDLNDISSLTKILSINASIEAAHAGNAGKGFAIVASEVKKLSEESEQVVKVSMDNTNSLAKQINDVNAGLDGIKKELHRVMNLH